MPIQTVLWQDDFILRLLRLLGASWLYRIQHDPNKVMAFLRLSLLNISKPKVGGQCYFRASLGQPRDKFEYIETKGYLFSGKRKYWFMKKAAVTEVTLFYHYLK